MTIRNLTELKKALIAGAVFKTINHRNPKLIGLLRQVIKVQTNAVYTVVLDQPDHEFSVCNHGMGYRMDFAKANHYEFGDTIKWFKYPLGTEGNFLVMEFKVGV